MSRTCQLAIAGMLMASFACTGCCLSRSYGLAGHCAGDSCGHVPVAGIGGAVACDDGSCGGACPKPGCLLGLGCFAKLFHFSHYGGGCSGCGEVYWHDWISDPPCADPCDSCGNWTGVPAVSPCDDCAGPGFFSRPILKPACGGPHLYGAGRTIYSTWTGLAGIGHHLKQGFLPHHGGCQSCSHQASVDPGWSGDPNCPSCAAGSVDSGVLVEPGIPLEMMSQKPPQARRRPPHPLVAERMR